MSLQAVLTNSTALEGSTGVVFGWLICHSSSLSFSFPCNSLSHSSIFFFASKKSPSRPSVSSLTSFRGSSESVAIRTTYSLPSIASSSALLRSLISTSPFSPRAW